MPSPGDELSRKTSFWCCTWFDLDNIPTSELLETNNLKARYFIYQKVSRKPILTSHFFIVFHEKNEEKN